jgi:glycosyltransferase involved in cell wall biosynthesis
VEHTADAVMCTGLRVFREHPGFSSKKYPVHLYYPPVDTEKFKSNYVIRQQSRIAMGVNPDEILIGTVGNINPQKGHQYLIRAVGSIRKYDSRVRLRIFGHTSNNHEPYKNMLLKEAQLSKLSLGTDFNILDPHDNVSKLLPGFDLFVMSSVKRSEGIPTSILEAMACGIPVIASDVGSIGEIICNGKTGVIVPPENTNALVEAIEQVLYDNRLSKKLSYFGRNQVCNAFNIKNCLRTHIESFHDALCHFNKIY